ncbi:MAG: hypothetical protein KJN97_17360 [Deltaproteobacteria bacterium]|nr:hypothetical protein [Deltaproteobacteria bacterium]
MTHRFALKRISTEAIARSVDRAEHYRLLNDPDQAESICLDILAVDDSNEPARIALILSLTDQFGGGGGTHAVRRADEQVGKLSGSYERAYYAGLVAERQGRAHLLRGGMARTFAYEGLYEAMQNYEQAEALKPPGVDDAILRWNACARTIERESLEPRREEPEHLLE